MPHLLFFLAKLGSDPHAVYSSKRAWLAPHLFSQVNNHGLPAVGLFSIKVYVGSSAGSMVVGKRISTAAYSLIYGKDSTTTNIYFCF